MCDRIPLEMVSNNEGVTYAVYLSESQLENMPSWNPAAGEPPLSLSEAYRLAMDWAGERYAKYDSFEIDAIALKPISCHPYRDRWYFKVEFEPRFDGNRVYGIGNYAVILLDGTVIGPKKSQGIPYSRKGLPPPTMHPSPEPNPI